ncbi:MAG: hypothetical protein ACT4PV_01940 [Planctomycetaceae bacterium]
MRRMQAAAAFLLFLLPCAAQVATAQDAPEEPWAIKFSHRPLELITVHYKDGSSAAAHYMIFTLENAGKVDAPLALHIKAVVGTHPLKRKVHLSLPHADAEEWVRRIARADTLKNIQELNDGGKGVLKAGETARGIAVFGAFDQEWDVATLLVSGLESRALRCRVRQYGDGFTLAHHAYLARNLTVTEKAGKDATWREFNALVSHDVLWSMTYRREGDEFAPQMDPITLATEEWVVSEDPAPQIVMEIKPPFAK